MADESKIDFGNTESCNAYLMSKFDDLLDGINNLYGKELMDELFHRLEKTIAQFHKDVQSLIGDVKSSDNLPSFRAGISMVPKAALDDTSVSEPAPQNTQEPSDWQENLK